MDRFGKAASVFLLAGSIVLPLIGCADKSDGKFETYSNLKKSAASSPAEPDQKETADASPAVVKATPADSKTSAAFGPNATVAAGKTETAPTAKPSPAAASESPAVVAERPSVGTKVTDAAFQASVVSSGMKSGAVPVSATASPRKVQLLVPEKKFRAEGPEGAWRVSYDDIDLLKVLNMDPVPPDAAAKMPGWLKGLEGKRIRIRGFMYPPFSQTGIHAFGLARDNQICCFGRDPKIYDVFDVKMRDGVTTDYLPNRPFDVVGVFHIRPDVEDGKLFHLYDMDDATVINK
jgi:hypothetical protein